MAHEHAVGERTGASGALPLALGPPWGYALAFVMNEPEDTEETRVEIPLAERIALLSRAVDAKLKALAPVARRLSRSSADQLATGRAIAELADALRAAPLAELGLGGEQAALVGALDAARARLMETRRRDFLEAFRAAFTAAGAAPALRAETPPEYRVGRLHAHLDFAEESVELTFARLPVERGVALDAGAVQAAWARAQERLAAHATEPPAFASAVAGAYRALLARRAKPAGERVELADLYAETAFALQPERFREDVDRRTLAPYPRVQFVWDLLRWRERGLITGDQRADLGVAVAGAATQKKRAFWLEDEAGNGMFYTSFRLVPREPS